MIAVADKGGTLSLGAVASINTTHSSTSKEEMPSGSSSLQWTTLALPASPRTFSGQHHSLCFSDGDDVWVGRVSHSGASGSWPDVQWRRTGIRGVIRIENSSGERSKVNMFTCDGRKYTCRWDEIKTRGEPGYGQDPKSGTRESTNTLESVMLGIQRCSEIMSTEGKEIATLDLYIRQLSLAHMLLDTSESPIFTATVRVEHSLERRGSYFVLMHLKKLRDDIELGGKWWSLLTVLPDTKKRTANLSLKLDEECMKSGKVCITIPLPDPSCISRNISMSGIKLVSYLVLEHPVTATPVCRIFACRTTVDAIHFLTQERILGISINWPQVLNSSLNFSETFNVGKKFSSIQQVYKDNKKVPLPPCKVCVLFRANKDVLKVLRSFLNPSEAIDTIAAVNTTSREHKVITLYHKEGRIDLSWKVASEDDRLSVTIEGTNPSLVLAVRAAMECRVSSELVPHQGPTTITSAVLWRGRMTQRVLKFETSETSTVPAVAHLHNTISSLLALFPHC